MLVSHYLMAAEFTAAQVVVARWRSAQVVGGSSEDLRDSTSM